MTTEHFIFPDWPAPPTVKALSTTRGGGISTNAYDSLNLATHVGDTPLNVTKNRARLADNASLPQAPCWMQQTHSNQVAELESPLPHDQAIQADGATSRLPQTVCAVMTADCLPLLFCNRSGTQVCATHAGWRGLASGIIENSLDTFDSAPTEILVWLGPAIGPDAFEVGEDVLNAFKQRNKKLATAFTPAGEKAKYHLDIYQASQVVLHHAGVNAVYGGGLCTYSNSIDFFSYRRDGVTGRMASLIWLDI